MKKIPAIIIIISVLGFFIPIRVLACGGLNAGNPELCSGSLNEDLLITVVAPDKNGNPLTLTDVQYTWKITGPTTPPLTPSDLGSFTTPIPDSAAVTCKGTTKITNGGLECTEIGNNSSASSTVNLHISSTATIGEVTVTVVYPPNSTDPLDKRTKKFTISTACTRDPMLYYGIASISEAGKNAYQSSTAEVMETCRTEYMLYEGIGDGN